MNTNTTYRMGRGAAVAAGVFWLTGCQSPDGRPDNTATGALVGTGFGAAIGALADHHHPGFGALLGAASGALAGGLIGHAIDQDQQRRLQAQSPQTYQTVQYNSALSQQPPPPPPPPGAAPEPAAAAPPAPIPLTLDDIKALAAAGVKPAAINEQIDLSRGKYSPADLAQAQQAAPPIDPAVIECMRKHAG